MLESLELSSGESVPAARPINGMANGLASGITNGVANGVTSPPSEDAPAIGTDAPGIPSADEATKAFYDEMWRNYGHLDAVSPAAFHRRRMIVELAQKHAPNALRILDVGCGRGELLRELSNVFPGAAIFGADVSEQSLVISREQNPTFELFELNLTHPTFERQYKSRVAQFDLVVCSEVLEHIENDRLAASHLATLIAPSGVAIVTVPGGRLTRFDVSIGHLRSYTAESLTTLLRGAAFDVDRAFAWGFPFHSLYRLAVGVASLLTSAPRPNEQAKVKQTSSLMADALSFGYTLFGKSLKPLYYLNSSLRGGQIFGVAKVSRSART